MKTGKTSEPTTTITAYAAETGLDARTVKRRLHLAGAEAVKSDGKFARYRTADVVKAMMAGEEPDVAKDPDHPRTRLLKLQGDKVEFQLSILRKEHLAATDVEQWIGEMIGRAKQVLLAGPSALSPQVVGVSVPEAEKLLKDWVHESLAKLSTKPPEV